MALYIHTNSSAYALAYAASVCESRIAVGAKAISPHLCFQIWTLNVCKGLIDPRPFHEDRRYRLMASDRKTVEFLAEQMAGGGTVSAKAMFGEFGIYCDGKMVALVCDDHLFVKPTVGGRAFAAGFEEAPPYPGAKPCLMARRSG